MVLSKRERSRRMKHRVDYVGPCVCHLLQGSNNGEPFPWRSMTSGGLFPKRCFACSCGAMWWCCDPGKSSWTQITDLKTWQSFLENDGVPLGPIGDAGGGVCLLSSLREKGLTFFPGTRPDLELRQANSA